MILFEKFGQHQPLNRQSERYRREGIDLCVSTLADQVDACITALQPLYALIERHVLAAERLHGDDTTEPILAKGKTVKGRIWTYVRDDRPFGGHAPPAARDRKSVCAYARNKARPFWLLWRCGCVRSILACRARPLLPSQSTTCSSVGTGLLFEDLHSVASRGCSPAPNAAPTEQRQWPR